jgi:hypothetical protein
LTRPETDETAADGSTRKVAQRYVEFALKTKEEVKARNPS